jgi:hypothetical protein
MAALKCLAHHRWAARPRAIERNVEPRAGRILPDLGDDARRKSKTDDGNRQRWLPRKLAGGAAVVVFRRRALVVLVGMIAARFRTIGVMIVIMRVVCVPIVPRQIMIVCAVASRIVAVANLVIAMEAMQTMIMQQAIGRRGQQIGYNRDSGAKPAKRHDQRAKDEKAATLPVYLLNRS